MLSMIVAHDLDRGIGIGNRLPWDLKEDLQHFREYTMGKVLVMGRATFDSLPASKLPGRKLVVLSRGVVVGGSSCEGRFYCVSNPVDVFQLSCRGVDVVVIGGSQVYDLYLPFVDELLVTELQYRVGCCDAFFPDYREIFEEVSSSDLQVGGNGISYYFKTFMRRKGV